MIFLLALIPATGLAIAGYFVLFLSNRSEGSMRCFGRYLGFWAFALAGLVILGSIFAVAEGGARRAAMARGGRAFMMHRPGFMMNRFGNRFAFPPGPRGGQPPAPNAAAPVQQPAAPAPAPAAPSAPAGL